MLNGIATDWKTLVPGEAVKIPGTDVTVNVYPLGLEQLTRFQNEIGAIYAAVKDVEIDPAASPGDAGRAMVQAVMPILTGKAFALLSECCVPRLEGAPVFVLPVVAESCIRQTFGGDRLNPWKAVAEKIVSKMTGISSIPALLLEISSRPGTQSKTSPTDGNADSTATNSPTGAGQSLSSPTT